MKKQEENIQEFYIANQEVFSKLDDRTIWPLCAGQLEAYFTDIISLDLFNKYKENPQKLRKSLSALRPFTLYSSLSHAEIVGLKVKREYEDIPTKQEIIDFYLFFYDILKEKTNKDIFCLNGNHRIIRKEDVEKIEQKLSLVKSKDFEIKKEISKLVLTLESLVWTLFYDLFPETGGERHGPYPVGNKKVIMIRDYFNLDSREIWPINNKYSSIKICLKYPKDVGIKINYINQVESVKTLRDNLLSFSIFANGKRIKSIGEITELSKYLANLVEEQSQRVNSLSPMDILRKGSEIYYYRYKNLYKDYNEDWKPPKQVYDRINGLGLRYWHYYKVDKDCKNSGDYYAKLLDPRDDTTN